MNTPTILRQFAIRCPSSRAFWLVGSPRNWTPGDAWLVSHDVFHHFEGEPGTVEREVMSFGVEHWLEPEKSDWTLMASSFGDTLADDFSDGVSARRLSRLRIPEVPAPGLSEVLPQAARNFLRNVCSRGLYEVVESLERHHEYHFTTAQRDSFLSESHVNRYANWAMWGYLRAQRRYPDAPAFQRAFQRLQSCVCALTPGDTARFSLTTDAGLVAENLVAARAVCSLVDSAVLLEAGHLSIRPRRHAQKKAPGGSAQEL